MGGTSASLPNLNRQHRLRAQRSHHQSVFNDSFFWLLPWLLVLISAFFELRQHSLSGDLLVSLHSGIKTLAVAAIIAAGPHLLLTRSLADAAFSLGPKNVPNYLFRPIAYSVAMCVGVMLALNTTLFPNIETSPTLQANFLFFAATLYWTIIPFFSQRSHKPLRDRYVVLLTLFGFTCLKQFNLNMFIAPALILTILSVWMVLPWMSPHRAKTTPDTDASLQMRTSVKLFWTGAIFMFSIWLNSITGWLGGSGSKHLWIDLLKATSITAALPHLFWSISKMEVQSYPTLLRFYSIVSGGATTPSVVQDTHHELQNQFGRSLGAFGLQCILIQALLALSVNMIVPAESIPVSNLVGISLSGSAIMISAFIITKLLFLDATAETLLISISWLVSQFVFGILSENNSPLISGSACIVATFVATYLFRRRMRSVFYWAFLPK